MPSLYDDDEKLLPGPSQAGGAVRGNAAGAAGPGAQWNGQAFTPTAPGNGAGTGYTDMLEGGGQTEATQTGFLNFDRFFNANGGVAAREAKRVNEGVANQANKAKKGIQGLNQQYLDALNGAGPQQPYDSQGNYQGGAAGPVGLQGTPSAATGPTDHYRQMLESNAAGYGNAEVPNWTDLEGFGDSLTDVREADRQLNALGSEEGLAELSGGNWADAALLGTAGRQAFKGTRDNYGKKGTGHESLADFADAVAGNAQRMGADKRREMDARGAEYRAALDAYDAEKAKPTDSPKQPTPHDWHSQLDELGKGFDSQYAARNAESRGYGNNLSSWGTGEQVAKEMGFEGPAAQAKWTEFRGLLPETLRDELDAILRYNTEQSGQLGSGDLPPELMDRLSRMLEVFRAWLGDNGTTESHTGGGLTSTETRNG